MKKRVLVPIKILAFALSAGCTAPEPAKEPPRAVPAEVDRPTAATTPPSPAATPAATTEEPTRALPLDIGDPHINTLRAELARDKNALSRPEHYRALCDKDGYPLVGNLNNKGPIAHEPSVICRAIREKAKAR